MLIFRPFDPALAGTAQTPEPHPCYSAQKDCKGKTMDKKTKAFPKIFGNALYIEYQLISLESLLPDQILPFVHPRESQSEDLSP
jgi:hypothetical protein